MKESRVLSKENIVNIILLILILGLGTVFVYINLVQYKLGVNADVAAEGLLAKIMWESKEWIPGEWYVGNELRLISTVNLAALFYGITENICFSMGIACVVAGAFVVLGAFYLGKELNFTLTQKLLFIFLVMMLPNNKQQIELMFIYGGYYAFHVGTYFVTLAVYLKILKKEKISKICLAFTLLLHFLIGAQGVRGILMITGPLMAVEVLRRIYLWWTSREWKNKNNVVTGFVLLLNVVEYVGGKFPTSVGHPLSRNIRKAPQKLVEVVFPDFFKAFHWESIPVMEKIIIAVFLGMMVYLAIRILIKGIGKKGITEEEWIFMNFFVSLALTGAALTFTTSESSSRYFLQVYFAIAMTLVMIPKKKNLILNSGLALAITVLFLGNYGRNYYPMVMDQSYKNNEYMQVGEYLLQEGYEMAYADFERAGTITAYIDGKIQVAAVNTFSQMDVCKSLSSRKWYVPNVPKESKTAYIVTPYKMAEMEEFLKTHPDVELKEQIGIYSIYGADYNYSKLTD